MEGRAWQPWPMAPKCMTPRGEGDRNWYLRAVPNKFQGARGLDRGARYLLPIFPWDPLWSSLSDPLNDLGTPWNVLGTPWNVTSPSRHDKSRHAEPQLPSLYFFLIRPLKPVERKPGILPCLLLARATSEVPTGTIMGYQIYTHGHNYLWNYGAHKNQRPSKIFIGYRFQTVSSAAKKIQRIEYALSFANPIDFLPQWMHSFLGSTRLSLIIVYWKKALWIFFF